MKNRMNKLAGKMNSMMICAHAALTDRRGEGYVDTAVKILMAVVIGALVLAGLYALFGDVVMPTLTERIQEKYPGVRVHVYPIRNEFFGEQITVSGLITGGDLIAQLKGKTLGERLLLPCNMFRSGEEVFLDDVALPQVEEALQVRADIVKSSGQDLIDAVLG